MSTASASPTTEKSARPRKRRRVAIACKGCRDRKCRCDGARPQCLTCQDFGAECVYQTSENPRGRDGPDRPRARLENRLRLLEEKLQLMSQGKAIHTPLSPQIELGEPSSPVRRGDMDGDWHSRSRSDVNSSIGEDVAVDDDDEDLQDSVDGMGAVVLSDGVEGCGFFGPTSNITLICQIANSIQLISGGTSNSRRPTPSQRRTRRASSTDKIAPGTISDRAPFRQASKASPAASGVDFSALPPEPVASALMRTYFSTTNLFHPCLHEESFFETYRLRGPFRRAWLGILNLVFAIAVSGASLGMSPNKEQAAEANMYYERALALSNPQLMRGASHEIVQFLLLMETYLQGSQRSVQTWHVHGVTVEAAFQAGLHSTEALEGLSRLEQEMRKRTWFCVVINDRVFSVTFGRPALIPEAYSKIDLPIDITPENPSRFVGPEVSALSYHYLRAEIELASITGEVIDQLFNKNLARSHNISSSDLFPQRLRLCWSLAEWQDNLADSLKVITAQDLAEELAVGDLRDVETLRFRIYLTMRFLHIRILLHRPILARFLSRLGSPKTGVGELFYLREQGVVALQDCLDCCRQIIGIVSCIVEGGKRQISLCGAWWLASYYTFNASLVIFDMLLGWKESRIPLVTFSPPAMRKDIDNAITVLRNMDNDNVTIRSCRQHITQLCEIYDALQFPNSARNLTESVPGVQIGMAPNMEQLQDQQYLDAAEGIYDDMGRMDDLLAPINFDVDVSDVMLMATKFNCDSAFYTDRDMQGMDLGVPTLKFM